MEDKKPKTLDSIPATQRQVELWRADGETIGFVPTMGALHEGHLSLVERAARENSKTVVSIFVNPTQFRPGEDFEKYPRNLEQDAELLRSRSCDLIFAPSPETMYGSGARTFVETDGGALSRLWEGAARPGHFRGVTTIVTKLFNIVRAHRAYFGEKDFQQLKTIEALVEDLNFPIQILACPTLREANGLALSSRNRYLSAKERDAAPALYQALNAARKLAQNGEENAETLISSMLQIIREKPILELEYLAVVNAQTLEPLETLSESETARVLVAARAGDTRLIDNIALR